MEVTTPFSTRVGMDHVRPSSQGSGTITHMKHVNEEESKEKLVGGLEHHFFVPYGNLIIPTDEIILLDIFGGSSTNQHHLHGASSAADRCLNMVHSQRVFTFFSRIFSRGNNL